MIVNNKMIGPITPERGKEHGDLLSSYLFIIGLNAFLAPYFKKKMKI